MSYETYVRGQLLEHVPSGKLVTYEATIEKGRIIHEGYAGPIYICLLGAQYEMRRPQCEFRAPDVVSEGPGTYTVRDSKGRRHTVRKGRVS